MTSTTEFSGLPFYYNSPMVNVDIDNQLAGILSQFNDDYIMDIITDSINNRIRLYNLPQPNIVSAYEFTFKKLTDGFTSSTKEIMDTRERIYKTIIYRICEYYNLEFIDHDDTDYYSIAYWMYDFFVSNFTKYLQTFYTLLLINERNSVYAAMDHSSNDTNAMVYSKKIFKDPKLAFIHCNLEYVLSQIDPIDMNIEDILRYVYQSDASLTEYVVGYIRDITGTFFKRFYQSYVLRSKDSADILTYIKLSLQQSGSSIEPQE